jgi:hypothetical protein
MQYIHDDEPSISCINQDENIDNEVQYTMSASSFHETFVRRPSWKPTYVDEASVLKYIFTIRYDSIDYVLNERHS